MRLLRFDTGHDECCGGCYIIIEYMHPVYNHRRYFRVCWNSRDLTYFEAYECTGNGEPLSYGKKDHREFGNESLTIGQYARDFAKLIGLSWAENTS